MSAPVPRTLAVAAILLVAGVAACGPANVSAGDPPPGPPMDAGAGGLPIGQLEPLLRLDPPGETAEMPTPVAAVRVDGDDPAAVAAARIVDGLQAQHLTVLEVATHTIRRTHDRATVQVAATHTSDPSSHDRSHAAAAGTHQSVWSLQLARRSDTWELVGSEQLQ